jgi:hypothetical protein
LALSPAEGDGILIAGNYSQENTNAANICWHIKG